MCFYFVQERNDHANNRIGYTDISSSSDETDSDVSDNESDSSYVGSVSPITSEEESLSESSEESDTETSQQSAMSPSCSSASGSSSFQQASQRDTSAGPSVQLARQDICLFSMVGDNVDKTIRQRYMRSNAQKSDSLHYFHSFAVRDRIDFSVLSDVVPPLPRVSVNQIAQSLFPSPEDDQALLHNFVTLISRVLVKHVKYFEVTFDKAVDWHIQHEFSNEMSTESEVVSGDTLNVCMVIVVTIIAAFTLSYYIGTSRDHS